MAKTKRDPNARQAGETYWQHQSRLARQKAEERDRDQTIVTKETKRHGYIDDFVRHVETGTVTSTVRNRRTSSLVRMHGNGTIDNSQFSAAVRIARVAELIERDVGYGCASLEARVDNSGSGQDVLIEKLTLVRDEQAYTRWRVTLPTPKRLVLDMLLVDRPLANTARKYGVGWSRARTLLTQSLDRWIEIREAVAREIDDDQLLAAHAKIMRAA